MLYLGSLAVLDLTVTYDYSHHYASDEPTKTIEELSALFTFKEKQVCYALVIVRYALVYLLEICGATTCFIFMLCPLDRRSASKKETQIHSSML